MEGRSLKVISSVAAAAAIAAIALTPLGSRAQQAYPDRDVHFICVFPPGSGADVLVRYFAEKVKPLTGKNIIVENRAGAGGNIAMEYVTRAKPDGLTIFVHAGSAVAANAHLFKRPVLADPSKGLQVVATINRYSNEQLIVRDGRVGALRVTGTFRAGDSGSFATAIAAIHPVRIVRTDHGREISWVGRR